MSDRSLIPKALTYAIRYALDASLPDDEIYLLSYYADPRSMGLLMSFRANAGLAERIATDPAGERDA